jgi:hypothetical protein
MKSVALLAILLVASCASDSQIRDHRSLGCESGQDIDLMVGLSKDDVSEYSTGDDRFEVLVNVSNNSHEELTVTAVRIEQTGPDRSRYQVDPVARRLDHLLPAGKEHTFHLPATGRIRGVTDLRSSLDEQATGVHLAVTVNLANGDSYRCEFDVGSVR